MEDRGFVKQAYDEFVRPPKKSGEDMVCQFISFLNESSSGLQVICRPNNAFGKDEWAGQWKALKMESENSLSSNCNQ